MTVESGSEAHVHLTSLDSKSVDAANNTLFTMVPFLRQAGQANQGAVSNTLFRVQNCVTGLWLCGESEHVSAKLGAVADVLRGATPGQLVEKHRETTVCSTTWVPGTAALMKSVAALALTRGRAVKLSTSKMMPFKDTFSVRKVGDDPVHYAAFVRCSFSDRILHSMMPLVSTPARLKRV